MKKSELIKKLNEISPYDYDVVLVDWGKNLNRDSHGDGSGAGMYNNFDVTIEENANEDHTETHFISFSFDNDDYNSDGECVSDKLFSALCEIDEVSPIEIGYQESIMKIRSITDKAIDFANNFELNKY